MYDKNFFQVDGDIEWKDLGNGVSRQMLGHNGQIMMVKVKFESGAVGAMHRHPHIQVSYVESGVFELTIGDQSKLYDREMAILYRPMCYMAAYVRRQGADRRFYSGQGRFFGIASWCLPNNGGNRH
ncbi:hypothetical protein LWM68_26045 [Niabella sp. W65]|nr:hypothetical protein [Niabella sp. W65]MCH7365924.1 hypothetical protein [Niabella sp. W65]